MKLLFVCSGNICRSAMAEMLTERLGAARGLDWDARSCGLLAEGYFQVPEEVWAALEPHGIARREHKPRLASRDALAWADLVLTMTRAQREALLDKFPEFTKKIFVLREHAGLPSADIADPFGRAAPHYTACRDQIVQALEALFARHEQAQNAGS